MTETLVELVLEEGKWLATAMFLSFIAVVLQLGRKRAERLARRQVILGAMNLFYGCMIGIMAFGHLLAVTVKLAQGTLASSLWILYPLGLALAIPSWWLALGIGLHNLGEGLSIGVALSVGDAALGSLLIVGFTVHNLTEGVAIVAPVARRNITLLMLAGWAALAGLPAVAGAWIGAFTFVPHWGAVFFGIAAGAILQVMVEVGYEPGAGALRLFFHQVERL